MHNARIAGVALATEQSVASGKKQKHIWQGDLDKITIDFWTGVKHHVIFDKNLFK